MAINRRTDAGPAQKVRLTLDISAKLNQILDDIASETGGTKSEVLRKAVAMLDVAHKATKEGKAVGVVGADNVLEKEFIGL